MKIKKLKNWSAAAIMILTVSCGEDEGQERESTGSTPPTQDEIIKDNSLANDTINVQILEATNAVADEATQQSTTLSLYKTDTEKEKSRTCVENEDGSVTVEINRYFDRQVEHDGKSISFSAAIHRESNIKRDWSQADKTIKCSENEKHIVMPFEDLVGLKLAVEKSGEHSRSGSRTNKRADITKTFEVSHSGSVKRNIEITAVETNEAGETEISKTISKEATREVKIAHDDKVKEFSMSIKTSDEAPLLVVITRDSTTHEWLKRTITSGTTIGTLKSGLKVESSFDNVVFSSKKKCSAISGTINGKVLGEDDAVVKTFKIIFSEDGNTITFDDDSEEGEEISLEGCDLEA